MKHSIKEVSIDNMRECKCCNPGFLGRATRYLIDSTCFTIVAVVLGVAVIMIFKVAGVDTTSIMRSAMQRQQNNSQMSSDVLEFDKQMEIFKEHAQEINRLMPTYRSKADPVQATLMTSQANSLAAENTKISVECQAIAEGNQMSKCLKLLKEFNNKAQSFVNFLQR